MYSKNRLLDLITNLFGKVAMNMQKLITFIRVTRANVIAVSVFPIFLGALAAFAWQGEFNWLTFILALIGMSAAHLFSNTVNDLWDYRNGADVILEEKKNGIASNSEALTKGKWTEEEYSKLTWALFAVAVLCALILIFLSGWVVLLFAILGFFFAYYYVAPPIKFGYRGKGYSEIAILFSFGILPVMGSYYVITQEIDYRTILLSLPIGILIVSLLFNHHFLHWRSDKEAGKKSLVVVWGEKKSIAFSRFLTFSAAFCIILCVVLRVVPVYTLIALISIMPLLKAYKGLKDENTTEDYAALMPASLQASTICGITMSLSLLIDGLL